MLAVGDGPDWTRVAPPREGCTVTPLIEAADMYPTLEHLVLDARRSVWLSFRVFDPETKTRSERCRELGIADWAALIEHSVRRGVTVRILLTDFEPVLADYLHAASWSTFASIRGIVEKLAEPDRRRLQLMVVQHEGEVGWGWRQLMRLLLRRRIRQVVETLLQKSRHDDGGFDTRPGLWRHVEWSGKKPRAWKAAPPPRLWPATYHQKFAVIDGGYAIIGGLDLDERRWDDRRHQQRADRTWHDISALIEGPVVGDAGAHFRCLWNREIPRYRATVEEWTGSCGRKLMLDPLSEIAQEAVPSPSPAGQAKVQLVRTLSRKSNGLFAVGPLKGIREVKAAHRELIRSARKQLYIEAQFFRSDAAGRWLEQALLDNRELEVIILIANTPEEIAFEKQTRNLAHRHGEHLQTRTLGRLIRKGGDRVGLFTLAKREPVKPSEAQFEESRGTAYGSGLIHIHAKLVVADDSSCLLSSANINGRSFEWDTELGVIWTEPDAVATFKRRLWSQLFGGAMPDGGKLAKWRELARFNAMAEPQERKGFVLPYQLGRARRFARPYWFIPDDLV
ncbi:MAG TPA: phospholipase D-like domain-containing protein [Allosphingosinicella sp.]|jgi:phosphatidylserine/phosphatidylglycerophosphate/cardiolipin synthase-like enzyme